MLLFQGQISEEDLSTYTVRQSSVLAMDLYGASSLAQVEIMYSKRRDSKKQSTKLNNN